MSQDVAILADMAYDDELAERIRECVAGETGIDEKRMFGGLAFLLGGHITVAAGSRGDMMLRCDPAQTESLVAPPHVERMVMRGKAMNGWLRIDAAATADDADLARWVAIGVTAARALPAK